MWESRGFVLNIHYDTAVAVLSVYSISIETAAESNNHCESLCNLFGVCSDLIIFYLYGATGTETFFLNMSNTAVKLGALALTPATKDC